MFLLTFVLCVGAISLGFFYTTVIRKVEEFNIWHATNELSNLYDRMELPEPEGRTQMKRFNFDAMIDSIDRLKEVPKGFDKYTVGGETTGIYEKWNADVAELQKMTEDFLTPCAQYYLNTANPEKKRERCMDIMNDWVSRYLPAIEGLWGEVFPWPKVGNRNWYQFSVSTPLFLFHYMVVCTDEKRRLDVATCVAKSIRSPCCSFGGGKRTQANSVYMSLPWLLAHKILGDLDEVVQWNDYLHAVCYICFQPVIKRMQEGMYFDKTYISHTCVLAFGYLHNMTKFSLPLIQLDNHMRNFMLDWQAARRILLHRDIPYGPVGFLSRVASLTVPTNADSPYGVQVMPTCLFLRMYDPEFSFACRGQISWIAYYESDKTYDQMAQYWVQLRRPSLKGKKYEPKFPDVGFIYTKYKTLAGEQDSDKNDLVTELVRIPTETSTTTWFQTEPIEEKPLRYGFVFAFNEIGMLRHFYLCEEMRYSRKRKKSGNVEKWLCKYEPYLPDEEDEHGYYQVDELVIANNKTKMVDVWVRILAKSAASTLCMYMGKGCEYTSDPDAVGAHLVHYTINCRTGETVSHKVTRTTSMKDEIAVNYPDDIEIVNTDNTVMLLYKKKPRIAMYPELWPELSTTFDTTYGGKTYTFLYDEQSNQFWSAGECVGDIDSKLFGGGSD